MFLMANKIHELAGVINVRVGVRGLRDHATNDSIAVEIGCMMNGVDVVLHMMSLNSNPISLAPDVNSFKHAEVVFSLVIACIFLSS